MVRTPRLIIGRRVNFRGSRQIVSGKGLGGRVKTADVGEAFSKERNVKTVRRDATSQQAREQDTEV